MWYALSAVLSCTVRQQWVAHHLCHLHATSYLTRDCVLDLTSALDRLYRDSTLYKEGRHVRDLSKLNRDLGKVLLIACDPDAYNLQPENAIKVGSPPAKVLAAH